MKDNDRTMKFQVRDLSVTLALRIKGEPQQCSYQSVEKCFSRRAELRTKSQVTCEKV